MVEGGEFRSEDTARQVVGMVDFFFYINELGKRGSNPAAPIFEV
jgi:hypothetical protein